MIQSESTNLAATTLDDLFRQAALRRPDAVALADPDNRESFTDGPPRWLTYAQADRAITAIATQLRRTGLPTDAIVGIALPNTVESVLTILGVLRAGMIAVPLPLLWRSAETLDALERLGATAIVTAARIGDFDAGTMAVEVASALFSIRQILGFGRSLPDGVISLEGALDGETPSPLSTEVREGNPAAHVALITFEVTQDGMIAVARNHAELIEGGLAAVLESGIKPDARLLGTLAIGSFAGVALTIMPWLLVGGTLSLHHSFDADVFAAQCRNDRCDTVVVPGALVPHLAEAQLLTHSGLKRVLAAWRAPERFAASPVWRLRNATLTDVLIFGEIALIAARRDADGLPVPPPNGTARAPRGTAGAVAIADLSRTEKGTLALRGTMVPRHPFPPNAARGRSPHLKVGPDGSVDTGYPCRIDRIAGTVTLTGPPPGIVSVGGYRFALNELEDVVRRADGEAFVTALPDALAGHRLAGISVRGEEILTALVQFPVNPLIADAFRRPQPLTGR